jgi:MoaA/NifB/PqqE/SkfB family radical SAM enzyme
MSKKTWCIYPFAHLATFTNGDVTPCCVAKPYKDVNLNSMTIEEAWNHPKIKHVRQQFLNGEWPVNCERCHIDEQHGVDSHRTSSNRVFEREHNLTEADFVSDTLNIGNLITLDLRLGNTCNLKCIMCRPNESHKWYDDIVELQKVQLPNVVKHDINFKSNYNRQDYNWITKTIFWDNIDQILPNIKEFIFGGGEPFMLKEVKTLLQKAIDLDVAKNMTIRFHTNGTHLTSKDYELLKHFKRIQLMFSVDGVDEINYFLRYPAEWSTVVSTINENEKYGPNIESFILCSLTGVSAYYLDRLYDFVHAQQWKKLPVTNIILGRVHAPVYLNPQALDSARKEAVAQKITRICKSYPAVSKTLQENLNWIQGSTDSATMADMTAYINSLFDIRTDMDMNSLKEFLNE